MVNTGDCDETEFLARGIEAKEPKTWLVPRLIVKVFFAILVPFFLPWYLYNRATNFFMSIYLEAETNRLRTEIAA